MNTKSISVLIGYSSCQLTRAAFESAGVDAWTCDLLPARGDGSKHLQFDVWDAIRSRDWDFGVFHPMCTYLTVSAAWALKDPDFDRYPGIGYHQRVKPGTLTGELRRAAQDEAIDNFRKLLSLPFPVAVENPAPSFVSKRIRPPDQIIQPYDFGDDASKSTGLWLTRGTPKIVSTKYREPRLVCENKHRFKYGESKCPKCGSEVYLPRWSNQTDSGQNALTPNDDRWISRSKTYPGIAEAMGHQWGRWIVNSVA